MTRPVAFACWVAVLAAIVIPAAAAVSVAAQAQGANPARPPASSTPPRVMAQAAAREEAKPTWAELTPNQQKALAPLAATWKTLGEGHKRKWLALSKSYPAASPEEQALMRSRMTEWAALSPAQRTQARLNFAESNQVARPDKKAAWEAYQALPPEEKSKLAAGAAAAKPPPPPTAPAVRPVSPQKLARVPQRKATHTPGIAVAPSQVDQNTLLPQPGAARPQSN